MWILIITISGVAITITLSLFCYEIGYDAGYNDASNEDLR